MRICILCEINNVVQVQSSLNNTSLLKINVSPTGELPATHKFSVIATTQEKYEKLLEFSDLLTIEISNSKKFLEKHNLKIIKGSSENDVTPELGRVEQKDDRDLNFLISEKLPITQSRPKLLSRFWDDNVWFGDQGNTPQCVGFAWAHWIDDGPVLHAGPKPNTPPSLIYREAQKIDEWPGENYAGTSVRAGAKYLQSINKISSYFWAFNLNTLVNTVLNIGPVVVGTNWYQGMFFPDRNGVIRISGRLAGGHAYVINGVDTVKQQFRLKNSWGTRWGIQGRAFISFSDMTRLIREGGEICLATERNF